MSVDEVRDRRAERFAATRREILDSAWELARRQGLIGISMRDLGTSVGMRAQSLYAYFPSKHAMYDAMFAEANGELLARLEVLGESDPVGRLRAHARAFVSFCADDPVRYQLLFQRTIPGFEPTPDSYAPAVGVEANARMTVAACGVTAPRAFDMWTAITSGVVAQQTSNEPGGGRWVGLLDDLIDMFLAHFASPEKAGI